ncbi:glycosyltransferase [Patescibacteria group bacterium]|nr:glycosyltransferase [Patescibacteria group bacterium]
MSRILITIPTWNEAVVIERSLAVLRDAVARHLGDRTVTIEVADNGSTDGTREIVRDVIGHGGAIHELPLRLIEMNGTGKGMAIRQSWERHLDDADILTFTDADLAADVSALPSLIRPIEVGAADIVCGSRYLYGSRTYRSWMRMLASRTYRFLQHALLHLPVEDAQCGFKAVSVGAARTLLPLLAEDGWLFDTELLAFASKKGVRIVEIPVDWIEHRDPRRRSAIGVFRNGWGFLSGLWRIRIRSQRNTAP